jgi:hypothetical protein
MIGISDYQNEENEIIDNSKPLEVKTMENDTLISTRKNHGEETIGSTDYQTEENDTTAESIPLEVTTMENDFLISTGKNHGDEIIGSSDYETGGNDTTAESIPLEVTTMENDPLISTENMLKIPYGSIWSRIFRYYSRNSSFNLLERKENHSGIMGMEPLEMRELREDQEI